MMYQCGRCGLTRSASQEPMGLAIPQCKCPWEFNPPVMKQPPKSEWVGLTQKERDDVWYGVRFTGPDELAKAIEAKLKEKNT